MFLQLPHPKLRSTKPRGELQELMRSDDREQGGVRALRKRPRQRQWQNACLINVSNIANTSFCFSISLLAQVDLLMPLPPNLCRGKHSSRTALVTKGGLDRKSVV